MRCHSNVVHYDDELNSVQLINWADIIIVSRQTSILIEAVKKKNNFFSKFS